MTKKIITTIVAILTFVFLLTGCESYKFKALTDVASADAVVESNGGLVVKQGEYIYFVNGMSGYEYTESSQNYFGDKNNELEGAIMRGKFDENGKIIDVVTVVPKNFMTSYTSGGFFVYGEWIYYLSPSTKASSSGEIKTSILVFMRTKIDGTGTQEIATVKSNTFEYTVTPSSIIYRLADEEGNYNLYHIDTTVNKRFKTNVVAEKISSFLFSRNATYDPSNVNNSANAVFYTKTNEEETVSANELYVLKADGTTEKVIDKNTFTDKPSDLSQIENVFTISTINTLQTADGVVLYYKKAFYRGGSSTSAGIFAYEFKNGDFTFDKSKEIHISTIDATTIYPINASSYYYLDGNILKKAENKAITEVVDFGASVTIQNFATINGVEYVYYLSSNALVFYPINGATGNARILKSSGILTTWLKNEIVNGYFFYSNSDDYNYTYALQLSSYNPADKDALVDYLLGSMSETDQAAKDLEDVEAE